jgi:Lamin Tail Domain/CotH kinase protein/Chitobiase/beta-hexosaminidase C-terminal domain/PA14 domain
MKSIFLYLVCLTFLLVSSSAAPAQVIISEFMADNKKTLADEDNQFPDWIELYNTSAVTVNLAGWALTDDPTHQKSWLFPATNLTAKGFLVVFASGKNRSAPGLPLHTDFSLKASGEYLALLKPDSSVATEFAPTFPPQYPDVSYGLAQDVTTNTLVASGASARVRIPTDGSLGTMWTQIGFNDSTWTAGATGIGYETAVPGFAVHNYIANVGTCSLPAAQAVISNPSQQLAVYAENAPVINYFNTGSSANYSNDQTFPGLTLGVDQDNFVLEATATITIPAPGNWTFGVNSDDGFTLSVGGFTVSWPNPRGPGDTLGTFYFSTAGDYPLDLIFYECGGGSEVELYAAQGSFGSWNATDFRLVGDVANGGLAVQAPVVSGGGGTASYRPLIATDVQAQMMGVNSSAYLRVPFNVSNPATLESLTLRMKYDDGFVAYLNGTRVGNRNAPAAPQWNSTATAAHPNYEALVFEDINVSDFLGSLQAGANVLAIQGLNQSAADFDFLVLPELVEYKATALTNKYFATPTPGTLNNSGFIAFVADTRFSPDRGFYDSPISLSITSATANATIIYTTNGSVPSLTNGVTYATPLPISRTTVIRAAAFKDGFQPSDVDTHSYIFVGDVVRQSPNGETPPGWPASWGGNVVDYGMDPDVVNDPAYSAELTNDLKSIPSYCITTDLKNLFDPTTGIYANPGNDGIDWERPAAIELIYPDGTKGFHINAGIRMRGGYSRSTGNPKHAFRFFFRQEYGTAKLLFPAFANQGGADSYDCFDLRTFENYSWSFEGDYRFIALRDQFSRDTQLAQGQQGERGDFYHLYINGEYWGLFNTDERPEASYGETYFGGNKEDYDVIKVDTGAGYTIFATDGNMDAWTRLWMAATNGFAADANYFKIQGLNVDGTPNPAYENLLDVDNLIDYMLVIFFTGNIDAPISAFIGDTNPNNMYGMRNRTGLYGGFRFFAHDSEHTLLHESSLGNTDEIHRDRTGPFPAGDPTQQGDAAALARSNPQYLFTRLAANTEFRLRVADHVQRQFFNGGVLTTTGCRARFLTRSNEVYGAIACESARWGDSKRATPLTRNVEWVAEMNRVYGDYFNQRPGIVLGQLRTKGWFPNLAAPSFNQFGGIVSNGFQLTLSAPAGAIYYTLDGSDPRLRGGAVSPTALAYTGPITLSRSAHFRARALSGTTWTALTEATFFIVQNFTDLLLTEIMYHPPGTTNLGGDEFEFIELKNVAPTNLELSGLTFTNGIGYTFPVGTFLTPGRFFVLVANPAAFTNRYPAVHVDGVYSGKLSNSGETLSLVHVTGVPIFSVNYGTRPPWPSTPDGTGFSLVPVNPNLNPDPANPLNWRASAVIGGSPGADDSPIDIPRVLVNEALTHTDLPQLDSVELYNPTPTNVDISNWYLTDQRTVPQKYRIPSPTIIPANGYRVITEYDWNSDPLSTNSFRLDSHGEEIYLYSADANGDLTGYSDGFAFGAAQNGVTFGLYIISTGEAQYPAQSVNSLGEPNAGPRVGPLVINEINYHPPADGDEFIELKSITNGALFLYNQAYPSNTWRLNGVGFDFPTNTQIAPNGIVLLVGSYPAAFRARYAVPSGVPIYGPYPGKLQGGGETLALQRPDNSDWDTNTGSLYVPYIDVDVVHYDDKAPWPTNADGLGASLERLNAAAYGNDPINWRASPGGPSPGLENNGNRAPVVNAGPDLALSATNAPIAVQLTGTASDDRQPNPPGALAVSWSQVSGPAQAWFSAPNQTNTVAYFPGAGTYVLRMTASDGVLNASDDVTVTIQHSMAAIPTTFVPKGSVWKYLDNGSDQGVAWIARAFNDTSWKSGPAPLGYGDANGQWPATTNSYGPDPNNKYITTYYRRGFSVSSPASATNLVVSVQRDDGVLVYLNGAPIFTNNMPAGPITYLTTALVAVGGTDETTFYTQAVDPALLVSGTNVLAAEIHQANGTSSDIIFDLDLSGQALPPNQPPSAGAGADQTVTLPAAAALSGTANDDGLPIPPSLLTFTWSKLSGPGNVTFATAYALSTTASFSAAGTYVLRLTASDGALAANDDLTVTVNSQVLPPFSIDSVDISAGAPPLLRLRFTAAAGQTYTIQYRGSLANGTWSTLTNVPARPSPQTVEITDPILPASQQRFYRIVAP